MAYMPFEAIILKYLPVTDTVYSLLRMVPELIIYLLFIYVLGSKILKRIPLNANPINKITIIFVLYSFLLILINGSPLIDSIIGLRSLLRYVILFYIVINLNINYNSLKKIMHVLIVIATVQSVIAIYHHLAGIGEFWMPRANTLEIAGRVSNFKILAEKGLRGGREIGVGIGTMGDSVSLAMYLVIGCSLIVPFCFKYFKKSTKLTSFALIALIIILSGLLSTYSRGSFLVAIAMIPIAWVMLNRIKKVFLVSIIIFIFSIVSLAVIDNVNRGNSQGYINPSFEYVNPIDNISSVFKSEYQKKTLEHSRGYTLTVVGSKLLQSLLFIGYGPSYNFALENSVSENFDYLKINNLAGINDVYWVAFIIYYGIIGLVLFLMILYKLFKVSLFVFKNSKLIYYQSLALTFILLVTTVVPYTFIIRTFVFRQFSFYFWAIAALVVIEWQYLLINGNNQTLKNNNEILLNGSTAE